MPGSRQFSPVDREDDQEGPGSAEVRGAGSGGRKLLLSAMLLALATGAALLAKLIESRKGREADPALVQQATAYQELSGRGPRFVEQAMAHSAMGALQMTVEELGSAENASQPLGHLVTVANPHGRVSLATAVRGCGTLDTATSIAREHSPKCRLAINAGRFNHNTGSCIGSLVVDGRVLQAAPPTQAQADEPAHVSFGIRGESISMGSFKPEEVPAFEQLVSGLAWLVRDGKNCVEEKWKDDNGSVPASAAAEVYVSRASSHTAVGVDANGRLLILQVDGARSAGEGRQGGIGMDALAELFIRHGALHAIDLDASDRSAMVRDGVVISKPGRARSPGCEEGSEAGCEQPVSSILCVHEASRSQPLIF